MNIDKAIKLLIIERNCVRHADVCNRECDKCKLVQDTDELLEMYDDVVKDLEKLKEYEDLEEQGRLLKLPCKEVYYIVDKNNPKYAAVMSKSIRDLTVYEIENIDIDGRYFSTEESAEAKLKELRGGENDR